MITLEYDGGSVYEEWAGGPRNLLRAINLLHERNAAMRSQNVQRRYALYVDGIRVEDGLLTDISSAHDPETRRWLRLGPPTAVAAEYLRDQTEAAS